MEQVENATSSPGRQVAPPPHSSSSSSGPRADTGDGSPYLYILIVMCFYGVFLCGIMLGYFRSKRREKRRVNVFTRLVHEEEQREWGALPKRSHSLSVPAPGPSPAPGPAPGPASLLAVSGPRSLHAPFRGNPGNHFAHLQCEDALPSPLACASCTEQSSVSSLCSSADTRLAIEEESDSGTAEGPEENPKGGSEASGDDTG